ncbi:heterokaryon incompatibility protein-domain-containing protein [Stachybotrys elegans]|uniref:Heterokaryon incompatibility protein-domain-containing protein n=1 Tax=Stachybotrys elegans TaxID=80388 RepID=A0A8K0STU0_9HYPO|nr:heterokaryon incompatibility protein-domain-containing protein [Stachybotrys elegans]
MGLNYSYRPLSQSGASEIRIIKLYPGRFEDGIRCELMHVPLTPETASYIALSYTWGSPNTTEPILLDGEPFTVTENLGSFLRHAQAMALAIAGHLPGFLRNQLPAGATLRNHVIQSVLQDPKLPHNFPFVVGSEFSSMVQRHVSELIGQGADKQDESYQHSSLDSCYLTFWIDAVCINQRDQEERSQQVGRMKEIYSYAQSTLIWLGDDGHSAEDVRFAFSLIHDIRQRIQPYIDHRAEWTEVIDLITSEDFVANRIRSITGIRQILTRPWFRRVWIIQEAATAQGPVVVMVGFHPIGWKFLSQVVIPCCEQMIHSSYQPLYVMFSTEAEGVHALRNLAKEYVDIMASGASSHDARTPDHAPKRLYSLLQRTCGFFQATDPRDVIYAILGLIGIPITPQELLPNYNASVGHVFHQTALYLVRYTSRIEFLRFRKREEEDFSNVPSWVPDWRYVQMGEARDNENLLAVKITENGLGLDLKGMTLGTVATVVYPTIIAAEISKTVAGGYEELPNGKEDDLRNAAISTLTIVRGIQRLKRLCLSQAQSAIQGRFLEGFQNAWEKIWLQSLGQFQSVWEMIDQRRELDLWELVEGPSSTLIVVLGRTLEELAKTGLAITSELELFTNLRVDNRIDEKDVVVLVENFREPLILRRTEDSFAFIGLCELHSFQPNFTVYREENFTIT